MGEDDAGRRRREVGDGSRLGSDRSIVCQQTRGPHAQHQGGPPAGERVGHQAGRGALREDEPDFQVLQQRPDGPMLAMCGAQRTYRSLAGCHGRSLPWVSDRLHSGILGDGLSPDTAARSEVANDREAHRDLSGYVDSRPSQTVTRARRTFESLGGGRFAATLVLQASNSGPGHFLARVRRRRQNANLG